MQFLKKYKESPVQVRATCWFLVCSFLQKGISVITTPIFTRLLSTVEYGKYSVFDSWLKIVTIFVSLQLYSGVYIQGLVKYSQDRERFASSIQGLSLSLSLTWTIVYLLFHNFWNKLFSLTTVQMLAMLVMIWASSAFGLWAGEQRVKYNYQKLVALTLIISLAKPVAGIVAVVYSSDKVTARILALALVELIGYSGLFLVQVKRGKQFYSKQYWGIALKFNIPLIPHYLSQIVLNSADRIMINEMVGAGQAGIYSLAYSVSQVMTLLNSALLHTLSPWLYQKIKDEKAEDIADIAYLSLGTIAIANLILIAITPEAVKLFAPESYRDAIWIIPPVAMSVVFIFSYDLFAKFEFYFEKTTYIMIASVIGAILNIILNFLFIGKYGYFAAAYTTLICYMIYSAAHYIMMQHVCNKYMGKVKVYNPWILVSLYFLFISAGFLIMLTYKYIYIRYFLIVFCCGVMFARRNGIEKTVIRLSKISKSK